jgi:DNA-binding transcriptional ArsR family regulator
MYHGGMPRARKHAALSSEAVDLVANRFRVLGEPIRIRILQELQSGEKNVTQLVEAIGSTQPNISKHLRILQESGLIGRRQAGTAVYCYIADPSVFELCDAVCASLETRLSEAGRLAAELSGGMSRKR